MGDKLKFDIVLSSQFNDALRKVVAPIDSTTAKNVGLYVTQEMETLISKGISPIQGDGKFPKYKNPKRYPGQRKPKSPVNLKLTQDFLNGLSYRIVPSSFGSATELFFGNNQEVKEKGHREGANGQPKRPILPSVKGETFTKLIRDLYTELYRERILEVLKGKG